MKNRIHFHFVVCIICIFWLMACGGGKYDKAVKVMKKHADVSMAYVNSLESADSADDVAGAINKYSDEMEKLIPDINKMMKDLPKIYNQETVPRELTEESERLAEAGAKIQGTSRKMFQYITDPEVQKALERMSAVMQKMTPQG